MNLTWEPGSTSPQGEWYSSYEVTWEPGSTSPQGEWYSPYECDFGGEILLSLKRANRPPAGDGEVIRLLNCCLEFQPKFRNFNTRPKYKHVLTLKLNSMKTKTTYLIITACVAMGFFLFNSFKTDAGVNPGKYLTLKVVEQPGLMANSFMVVVDEDGKFEETLFEKFKIDNITPNTIKVNSTINDISKKGYDLFSHSSNAIGGLLIDTYTFTKK